MTSFQANGQDIRRYDMDWLRVCAFMLLILYHVGMYYVADWEWHVKSPNQSEFLQNIMLWSNQWRMQLLFVISGLVLAIVEPKINGWQLFKTRHNRLMIPLVFGMLIIVPPQLYYQLIQYENYHGGYLEFMSMYLDFGTEQYPDHQHSPLGLITWNHLWYLPYLFTYTLIYIGVKPLLKRIPWAKVDHYAGGIRLLMVFIIIGVIARLFIRPYYPQSHALVGDWYNHAIYLTAFFTGYALARLPNVWHSLIEKRRLWLAIAVIHYGILLTLVHDSFGFFEQTPYKDMPILIQAVIQCLLVINITAWLLTMISFAGRYFRTNHPILRYMNDAVLPWYILHQSITIIAAMWLLPRELGSILEPLALVIMTFGGCAIGYELIKRWTVLRFLFGLKAKKPVLEPKDLQLAKVTQG